MKPAGDEYAKASTDMLREVGQQLETVNSLINGMRGQLPAGPAGRDERAREAYAYRCGQKDALTLIRQSLEVMRDRYDQE